MNDYSWCNVHEPRPTWLDEPIDESADVFAAVAAIEESSVFYTNLNLNGKFIMTDIVNTQLADQLAAAVVHTRWAFGSPLDVIETALDKNPDVTPQYKRRIFESMAWRGDMLLLAAARSILFDLYSEDEIAPNEKPADHFQRFCAEMHDVLKRDSLWDHNETCKRAAIIARLRLDWHDQAEAAANEADWDYNPKSLNQLLLDEKPRKVSVEVRANYEQIAQRQATNRETKVVDKKKYDERLAALIARDELLAASRVNDNRELIPVIEVILDAIERNTAKSATFDMLANEETGKRTMRGIAEFAMQTIERITERDMATDRKLGAQAFGRVLDAQDEARDALKAFREMHCSEAEELESAHIPNSVMQHNRRQKELASSEAGADAIAKAEAERADAIAKTEAERDIGF